MPKRFRGATIAGIAAVAARAALRKGGVSYSLPPGAGAKKRAVAARKAATRLGASVIRYRKKKQNLQKQKPLPAMGGVGTFSQFKLINKPSKRVTAMKRVGAENFYLNNGAFQVSVEEGFQATHVGTHLGFNDLQSIATRMPPTSGGALYTKQWIVESDIAEYLMTNSSLATMYVDIYDIVRKRDAGYSVIKDDPSPTNSPDLAWSYGVSDEAIEEQPNLSAWKQVNSLPTDSRLFRDYFRVIKRTHVSLAQGATHRHHVALATNRLIDNELLQRGSGDLKGFAVYTMIVAYGQPCSVPTEANAIVTTASGKLDVVYSERIKYTFVQDNAVAWFRTDNLSTLKGEKVVSAGAGAIVLNDSV